MTIREQFLQALRQILAAPQNSSLRQVVVERDLARLYLRALEYLSPEEIHAMLAEEKLAPELVAKMTTRHLEKAGWDVIYQPAREAQQDLLQRMRAISEAAEHGTISQEDLRARVLAFCLEMVEQAEQMDLLELAYPPPPLPELPEGVALPAFVTALKPASDNPFGSGHFWRDACIADIEAVLRGKWPLEEE